MISATSLSVLSTPSPWNLARLDLDDRMTKSPGSPAAWLLASGTDGARLLSRARELLDDELTAAVVMGRWCGQEAAVVLDGLKIDAQIEGRLIKTLGIVGILRSVEAMSTIQAWFAGMNPLLDDQSPAIVLATDPDAVVLAAQDFVAYG